MKTKDLIKLLQNVDPSGETECCVFNADVFFVSREPAYLDGSLQVLKRDESRSYEYNVIGAEYRSKGEKVCIRPMSVVDYICDCIDFGQEPAVGFDSEHSEKHYKDFVQRKIKEMSS